MIDDSFCIRFLMQKYFADRKCQLNNGSFSDVSKYGDNKLHIFLFKLSLTMDNNFVLLIIFALYISPCNVSSILAINPYPN